MLKLKIIPVQFVNNCYTLYIVLKKEISICLLKFYVLVLQIGKLVCYI